MPCIGVFSHHRRVSFFPSNILHKTSECAGLPGRGRSSVLSVFHGQFNVCPGRNKVSVIIPQFAFVPLIMASISSSLLAAPIFTFHNAVFTGVWSFPMLYRGTSAAVWRSGPDTTLLLLIRDAVQNPLKILKASWAGKVPRYAAMVHEAGRSVQLLPVPISTLGGWHPDAHRALCSVATTIAARGMSTFSSAKSILFQRHAALLVTNNALCLMSGLVSGI